MALKHNYVNPLAVNNMRQLDFLPAHFERVTFDLLVDQKNISDWLYENTDGRFYIGQAVQHSDVAGEKPKSCFCVGFEVHAEASYFAIMLPSFNQGVLII